MKLATFLPCLLISLIIMSLRGNLFDFANLCFGGILEFGNSNFSISFKSAKYICYAFIVIIFTCIVLANKNISADLKRNIKFLLCVALGLTLNMYPLANEYHSVMTMVFYFILFIYIVDQLMINDIFEEGKKHKKICIILSSIIFFFIFCKGIYLYFSDIYNLQSFEKDSPFYNAKTSSETLKQIEIVTKYIELKQSQGTKVLFLTQDAFAYMVPLNINNNEFDLPFSGNLGYNGIQKTIDKISQMENTEFIIYTDEENCFFQESKEIREYILNHFKKIGELFEYSIYTDE